jgi:flagella basal body P-ring formation protein FlgA
MMIRSLFAASVLAALAFASPASAAPPQEVVVVGSRIHVGDVASSADATVASVDIGPSPSAGSSRLVTKNDIVAALTAKELPVPATLPDAVRVVRKAQHLTPAELDGLVRGALNDKPLGHGVTLTAIRATHPVDVAEGWARIDVDVPHPPKRQGAFTTTAIASFFAADGEAIARVPVPMELAVSAEGALYDTPRGASVTLVIRRNYIEVRTTGMTTADADLGDPVPVQLPTSGRVLRARLTAKDEAVAIEDGR